MARRRDQTARRSQLVEAAAQAVLAHGSTNARLRDIAAEAGLTPASVLYYYPDMGDLLAAVFEQGTRTYILRRQAALEAATGAWERLDACLRTGVPFPGEPMTTSRLLYELVPITFRNELAAAEQATFFAQQVGLYEQVLDEGEADGTFRLQAPAPFLARGLVALEDGYGIEVVAGSAAAEDVLERLRTHARLMVGLTEDRAGTEA
ncbi:TetR/AcrR family transcriptional regulator [Nocardioides sp. SYSU DS0663]|uniref:TetR/AcrR family transcriptional regulator n=1 Tax=Nocardioides sp. SYSU DS0663 TaxID=3416445 RepID=UPI003F4BAEC7